MSKNTFKKIQVKKSIINKIRINEINTEQICNINSSVYLFQEKTVLYIYIYIYRTECELNSWPDSSVGSNLTQANFL